MKHWGKTVVFLVVAAVLTRVIPFSSFFRNVDTLVHEFGHAIVTLLVSGKVLYIHLFADHSGVTYSSAAAHSWRFILIALAGYIVSTVFAVLLFYGYARGKQQTGLMAILILTAISLLFFVRNGYGVMWCIGFLLLTAAICFCPWPWLRQGYYLLVAFIALVESVLGPVFLLILAVQNPGQAGDAANLARLTPVPAALWALLFTAVALLGARECLRLFLHPRKSPRSR
ncbi:M50 family metallopeptidase [Paenibacillus thiaminolyticus]|uniref:M50 family metallopeptidase n=1 Tax=Paenibacillus thiaminolyticus TaxID=49283 RepID=UPI00232D0EE2|nr:M50 family metallopeptidase [Paenibacillus thiaminolyticus]MDG0872830.1 M50 family metallopeptidase [Paenibacillus thiaminolyticus]WCF08671.1 M50 family metallopeptidase [Paenibacillus thiaminolyticus]WII37920.1 M50 family metallopeptidase [Paenibacillus thiaminolyticus]